MSESDIGNYYKYPDAVKYFLDKAKMILVSEWEVDPSQVNKCVYISNKNTLKFIKFSFIEKDPNKALDMLTEILKEQP